MSLSRLGLATVVCCPILAVTVAAPGQARQVMVTDDGSGPQVMHFSMPDLHELRTPDYTRDDLPSFYDKLSLEEPQKLVVQVLMEAYLKAFDQLATETLPESPPMLGFGGMRLGGPGGHGDKGDNAVIGGDVDLSGLDFIKGEPGEVSVRITAGGPGGPVPEGAGGGGYVVVAGDDEGEDAPPAQVMIAVGGDGVELSEEDVKALEEKAAEMLEKVHAQMEAGDFAFGTGDADPEAAADARERMKQMQARMDEMAERAKAFAKARKTLTADFEHNVKSQLTIEQLGGWPDLERVLVRRKTLPRGRLDAERTDLLQVFDSIAPTAADRNAVVEQLDAYEMALHEALLARNAYLDDANGRIDAAIREGAYDKALEVVDKARDLRVAVRDTNREHLEQILALLSEDTAERFRKRAMRNFHPRVYRRTVAERAFAAAAELAGDDVPLKVALRDLRKAYQADRNPLDAAIVAKLVEHQPDQPRRGIERLEELQESGEGRPLVLGHEDEPVHEAFARRNELDEKYLKRLRDLFPPEIAEKLPRSGTAGQPVIIRNR